MMEDALRSSSCPDDGGILDLSLEIAYFQVERLLAKFPRLLKQDLWRPSFAENSSSVLIGFPHTLLVYPSLRTIIELYSFISEEDYSYFV